MELYVKKNLFPYFIFFFWFSNMILSDSWFYQYRSFKHIKWWRNKL